MTDTDTTTRLGRRAQMLGTRMASTSRALANGLGAGGQPAFTTAMSQPEALEWWRAHRGDEFGQRVVATMQPQQVAALDAWLGGKMADERGIDAPG